jgi:lipoprotein NlpD
VLIMLAGCAGQYARAPVTAHRTPPEPRARVWTRAGAETGASAAATEFYAVRRGDTLYSLAWQQGMDFQQLARLNGIAPPYTIYPGQRLRLHVGGAAQPGIPAARPAPLAARPLPAPPSRPDHAARAAASAPQPPSRRAAGTTTGLVTAFNRVEFDGKWVWPVHGKILHPYREDGAGKKGIEIGGRNGQPVLAAANGKVVYVGSGLVGYGRLIIVKHNDSLLSAYGYNSELLVGEGEFVRAGQTIAKMGSSGTSQTALYFEIRKDGKPVNPARYLP